jgi:hypothetical protein
MNPAFSELYEVLPRQIVWKAELLFTGVKYNPALTQAVAEGAAQNYWPYRKIAADGTGEMVPVPYLFKLDDAVARVRVNDASEYEVRRDGPGYMLFGSGKSLCEVEFVREHSWASFRTSDGATYSEAGVEQLGDMLVVNLTPGCEYFMTKSSCKFCGYGRFNAKTQALGQLPGIIQPHSRTLERLGEVLANAAKSGEARHVYIVGGSTLKPEEEVDRFVPVIKTARKAVGDAMHVTAGSGAVDKDGSLQYRDAGADTCCYNLETWDAGTFEAVCPGKAKYVGRDRWIKGLTDAVDVFGWGNVASAFVAGVEAPPPAPGMTTEQMLTSIKEGAGFLLDRGITPLYSPLWPVDGTAYTPSDGISPTTYLKLEYDICQMRADRSFPVPDWLICPGCSYMLMEVDFDAAFGLNGQKLAAVVV